MKRFIYFFIFFCTACTTTQYNKNTQNALGTPLTVPTPEELAEKQRDPIAERLIEKGTPESLRKAVDYLGSAYKKLTPKKQLYLSLATKTMNLLYPFESSNWKIQSFEKKNAYLDALESVIAGEYPQNTSTKTFLSTIIPAYILVQNTAIQPYEENIEQRINRAINLNPKAVLPYYLRGLLYERQHQFAKAETAYKKAWDKDNSCYPAGMQFCRLALQRYSTDEVLDIAETLAKRFPENIEVQTLLAQAYCAAEQWEKASELIQTLNKKAGTELDVFFLYAKLLIKQKKYLQASMLLDSYGKRNKTEKQYLLLRTQICREWTKNTTEALQYLTTADTLYPQAGDVLRACAHFCFETGEKINEKTVDDFISLLLKQDPENMNALRLLIKRDIIREDWLSAFDRAESLYESTPSEANRLLYIETCIKMKKWKDALETASAAYKEAKNPSTALTALYLDALFGAKHYRTLQNILADRLPTARTELKSILLYYQSRIEPDNRKKLPLLRLSLLADPRNKHTLFALYEWYYLHDDYKKAHYYLQQVIAFEPGNRKYIQLNEKLIRILEK